MDHELIADNDSRINYRSRFLLRIVLLPAYVAACLVLFPLQVSAFAAGDLPVGLGTALRPPDPALLGLQLRRFPARSLT